MNLRRRKAQGDEDRRYTTSRDLAEYGALLFLLLLDITLIWLLIHKYY